MKLRYLAAIILLVSLLGSSCSSRKTTLAYFEDIITVPAGQLDSLSYLTRIAPDDELRISITSSDLGATANFNLPEVNLATRQLFGVSSVPRILSYMVNSQGDIEMPEIGLIHVSGMTVEELKNYLEERLRRWVADPLVTVDIVNFTVSVGGEVRQPKNITVNRGRYTILEALAEAGDLTEYGERSNIFVIRDRNGKREYAHLDLNNSEMLNSEYFYLEPNDYVYVAPNKVRQENSKYNQNNGFKLQIISTIVSAASVVASLVIALTVK